MTAALFADGDTLIGTFECGARFARVMPLSRHGEALCFVDRAGRDLGPLVGAWTSAPDPLADWADGRTHLCVVA